MKNDLKRISLAEAEAKLGKIEKTIAKEDSEPIDPNIRPVIIAFMAHGFPVAGSCEGHLDHQGPYPWLAFEVKTGDSSKKAYLKGLKKVRAQVNALTALGREFYELKQKSGSKLPYDRILFVSGNGFDLEEDDDDILAHKLARQMRHGGSPKLPSWIGYWLKCMGADSISRMPSELLEPHKKEILKNRQQDMLDFAEFLRSKL